VNWLTTHLINALGHTPVTRTRARIAVVDAKEVCRVDVAAHSGPVWAKTSKADRVLFARINNSTRAIPDDEAEAYVIARWQR
jgi:type I restriction enzyme, R subunit